MVQHGAPWYNGPSCMRLGAFLPRLLALTLAPTGYVAPISWYDMIQNGTTWYDRPSRMRLGAFLPRLLALTLLPTGYAVPKHPIWKSARASML